MWDHQRFTPPDLSGSLLNVIQTPGLLNFVKFSRIEQGGKLTNPLLFSNNLEDTLVNILTEKHFLITSFQ